MSVSDTAPPDALDPISLARLRVALLAEGLRTTVQAQAALAEAGKPPLRVRSGSCGGLDLIFPDGSYVNCPVLERFAAHSPFVLDVSDGELLLRHAASAVSPVRVRPVPMPDFYGATDRHGRPLQQTGQLCSDRLGVGLTNACTFYRSRTRRCQFCSIGLNTRTELGNKETDSILDVVDAAFGDSTAPARHVLLGGGTPDGPDSGALAIAAVARAISRRHTAPIYAMLAPPTDLTYLDELHAAGVAEVGMNVELFSTEAAVRFMPAKHEAFPLRHYLRALERCVDLFGPVNTRSICLVGLEPAEETLAGVELLASRGVMPILTPFRPMTGTPMEDHPRASAAWLWDLTVEAAAIAGRYGIPLGPTCVPCQSNTLTVPGHPAYRHY
jgi:Radical SAM superfamily